ncbi:hypothetical protein PIB30_095924, partial [Stylosanthes scabra]|nr:hypothetical protein [Stylosanthes scabra]
LREERRRRGNNPTVVVTVKKQAALHHHGGRTTPPLLLRLLVATFAPAFETCRSVVVVSLSSPELTRCLLSPFAAAPPLVAKALRYWLVFTRVKALLHRRCSFHRHRRCHLYRLRRSSFLSRSGRNAQASDKNGFDESIFRRILTFDGKFDANYWREYKVGWRETFRLMIRHKIQRKNPLSLFETHPHNHPQPQAFQRRPSHPTPMPMPPLPGREDDEAVVARAVSLSPSPNPCSSTIPGIATSAHVEPPPLEDNQDRYNEMITDAFGMGNTDDDGEEEPNPDAARFYDLLETASKPLFDGCVHSKLSACVRMMSIRPSLI